MRRATAAAVTMFTLLAGPAGSGCTVPGGSGAGDGAARASAPCSLLTGEEVADAARSQLRAAATVDGRQESDGNPGSRVCQYRLELAPAGAAAGGGAGAGAVPGGVELYAYTADTGRALTYYRSLTSDNELVPGLGDGAWWSTRGQRLLVVKGEVLLLAHVQLPRAYRDRDRGFVVALGRLAAGRV